LKTRSNYRWIFLILLGFVTELLAQTPEEKKIFEYVNQERIREGRTSLIWDEDVYRVARLHSQDMSVMGRASHKGSDGRRPEDRVRDAGIFTAHTGENIARDINVISAHTMLMQSLDHRENILDPDFTHAAVGVIRKKQFLYVTELFIHKVGDIDPLEATQLLLKQFNTVREKKKMSPLVLSESLSHAAQSQVELQSRFDAMSPMLAMSPLTRTNRRSTLVTAYTANSLMEIPVEIQGDLETDSNRLGIGFKRIRGGLCSGGCYLIVLVFG